MIYITIHQNFENLTDIKEINGGKGGPGSRQNRLDMKMSKNKMLETKVLDENKGGNELMEVVNRKKFFKCGLK